MNTKAVLSGLVFIFVILIVGIGIGLSNINAANAPKIEDDSGVIVNIPGQGRVRGGYSKAAWTNETYMHFKSIPYAEPPIGALRFKAPVPHLPWTHIHDSTNYSRACPSMDFTNPSQNITTDLAEDCLTVSVYTKSLNASVPVIFFVIGGAFSHGSSSENHADFFLNENVVLVIIQYRLGALGFLSLNTPELPGNMALADVIMALEWVQNNIHNFGGDKNRVTMLGQSAGSCLTSVLLLSPKTENRNFFHRVIMQSGNILSTFAQDPDPIVQTHRFCKNIKCSDCEDPDKIHECLMKAELSVLRNATVNEKFEPKIETQLGIMPQHPNILLENYNRSIPILVGYQRHDGSLLMEASYGEMKDKWGSFANKTVRQFAQELFSTQTDYSGVINNVLLRLMFDKTPELLDSNDHQQAIPAYFDIDNMIFVKSAAVNMAKHLTAKKLDSKNYADTYFYTFDYISDDSRISPPNAYPWKNIAGHGLNSNFLFAKVDLADDRDIRMAKEMVSLYTSFAYTGIPRDLEDTPLSPMTGPSGPFTHFNVNITQGFDVLKELTTNIDDPNKNYIIKENIPF